MEFGVDEAGKGPVLGSMFVAAVGAPREAVPDGVEDSKALADERREALADRLRADDRVTAAVVAVPPARIDAANLNDLLVAAHAEAATSVARPGDTVLCDAGDVDADRFAARVADRRPTRRPRRGRRPGGRSGSRRRCGRAEPRRRRR